MREQREKNENLLQDRLRAKKKSKGTKQEEELGKGAVEVVNVTVLKRKHKSVQKSPLNNSLYLTPPSGTKTYCKKKQIQR